MKPFKKLYFLSFIAFCIIYSIAWMSNYEIKMHSGRNISVQTISRGFPSNYTRVPSNKASVPVDTEGRLVIPPPDTLESLEMNDLQELYHRYLENIQIICQRQIHLGDKFDGGYHVCEDPDVIPVKPCLVYSFGIRKDFSFDDAVARTFGCEVHSFDPGDGQQDHQHSDSVTFHSQGIADRDGTNEKNWTLKTLQTIKKQLGHEQTRLNLLKLDVEGSEWSALAEMIRTGSIDDISQLIVEFHIWVTYGGVTNLKSREDYVFHLNILRDLYEMGFRIFFLRRWHHYCIFFDDNRVPRTGCHETHFLRIHR